ncbi:hypothetical protein ILYODFUR_033361 [Ilyodon furcidens]
MEEMQRNSSPMACLRQRLNSHIHTENRAVFPAAAAPIPPGNTVHHSRPSFSSLCSDKTADNEPVGTRVGRCLSEPSDITFRTVAALTSVIDFQNKGDLKT